MQSPGSLPSRYGSAFANTFASDQTGHRDKSAGPNWLPDATLPMWNESVQLFVPKLGCEEFTDLPPGEREELGKLFSTTKNICRYTFLIRIPAGTKTLYSNINLHGTLMTQTQFRCAPDAFGKDHTQEGIQSYACDFPKFSWLLDEKFTDAPVSRDARLKLAFDGKDAQFWFCLEGKGPRTKHGCSCLPVGCKKPSEDDTLSKE
jgi:hypothetical protein